MKSKDVHLEVRELSDEWYGSITHAPTGRKVICKHKNKIRLKEILLYVLREDLTEMGLTLELQ